MNWVVQLVFSADQPRKHIEKRKEEAGGGRWNGGKKRLADDGVVGIYGREEGDMRTRGGGGEKRVGCCRNVRRGDRGGEVREPDRGRRRRTGGVEEKEEEQGPSGDRRDERQEEGGKGRGREGGDGREGR
jgi:hypothetical protein